jgi:hypothetical protein
MDKHDWVGLLCGNTTPPVIVTGRRTFVEGFMLNVVGLWEDTIAQRDIFADSFRCGKRGGVDSYGKNANSYGNQ